jgi:hypothetical protein
MNFEEPVVEVVGPATELIQTQSGGHLDGGNLHHSRIQMLTPLEEEE